MFERDFSELLENGFRETRNHKTRGKVCEPNLLFTPKLESHRERETGGEPDMSHTFQISCFAEDCCFYRVQKKEEENKKSMICETQSVGLKVVFTNVLATFLYKY